MKIILWAASTVFLISVSASCWRTNDVLVDDVVGKYVFNYQTGEVEVLSINRDSTFRKDIFVRDRSMPKFTNFGRWAILTKNELVFYNWLMNNEFRDPQRIRTTPECVTMANVHWHKEGLDGKAIVSVSDEYGYIFQRTK